MALPGGNPWSSGKPCICYPRGDSCDGWVAGVPAAVDPSAGACDDGEVCDGPRPTSSGFAEGTCRRLCTPDGTVGPDPWMPNNCNGYNMTQCIEGIPSDASRCSPPERCSVIAIPLGGEEGEERLVPVCRFVYVAPPAPAEDCDKTCAEKGYKATGPWNGSGCTCVEI